MTTANRLTFSRILFIPLFMYFLLTQNTLTAAVVFAVIALTDLLDGYVARSLKQESDIGKFLDPLADKLLVLSGLICLVELGKISSIPVVIILARELAVQGIRIWQAKVGTIVAASPLSKWKTFLQIVAVLALILDLPYAVYFLWVVVVITLVSGWNYLKAVLYSHR